MYSINQKFKKYDKWEINHRKGDFQNARQFRLGSVQNTATYCLRRYKTEYFFQLAAFNMSILAKLFSEDMGTVWLCYLWRKIIQTDLFFLRISPNNFSEDMQCTEIVVVLNTSWKICPKKSKLCLLTACTDNHLLQCLCAKYVFTNKALCCMWFYNTSIWLFKLL